MYSDNKKKSGYYLGTLKTLAQHYAEMVFQLEFVVIYRTIFCPHLGGGYMMVSAQKVFFFVLHLILGLGREGGGLVFGLSENLGIYLNFPPYHQHFHTHTRMFCSLGFMRLV